MLLPRDWSQHHGHWYTAPHSPAQYLEAASALSSPGLCEVWRQGGLKQGTALRFHHLRGTHGRVSVSCLYLSSPAAFWQRRREEVASASTGRPSVPAQAKPRSQMWRDTSPAQPTSQGTQAVGGSFVKDVMNPWRALTHPSWQKHLPRPSSRPVYNPLEYENLCKVPPSYFSPTVWSRVSWLFVYIFILKPIAVLRLKWNLKVSSCVYSLWTPEGERNKGSVQINYLDMSWFIGFLSCIPPPFIAVNCSLFLSFVLSFLLSFFLSFHFFFPLSAS